ncbi:glycoside hydrolase family protein [Pseudofrankia sp. BMG5.36]|uniref:glycoside hydrolase family protein n=1 Tax=Pseudofrankia sp. BMG5.36 TaxID=1834512 RepID=UPI0009F55018|nr:glycoside hydrolase family protein [Pseudofrankia sp. BMG5.36]
MQENDGSGTCPELAADGTQEDRTQEMAADGRIRPAAARGPRTRPRRRWSRHGGGARLGLSAVIAATAIAVAGCLPSAGTPGASGPGTTIAPGGPGTVPTASGASRPPTASAPAATGSSSPSGPASSSSSPTASVRPTTAAPSSSAAPPPPPPAAGSGKRGISIWDFGGLQKALNDVGVTWYYNWAATPRSATAPPGAQFVPMIWGAGSVNAATLGQASAQGDTLLGFNEPDLGGQANMTVDAALNLWPQLQATGKRLGSPAVAYGGADQGGWLDRFMTGAKQRGYRVDFITLHWYGGDFNTSRAVDQLRTYLQAVYNRYRLPIWLTEYALMDFSTGTAKAPSTQQQADFVTASTTMLESLPFLSRYAWFALPATPGSLTGLYDEQGNPNAAGLAYRRAGSTG